MARICVNPNCSHYGEEVSSEVVSGFCPYCNSELQDKPSESDGTSVNLRGSAVNGGLSVDSNNVQTSDSHNIQTSDSHNVQTTDSHNQSIVTSTTTSDSHNQSIVQNTSDSNNTVNSNNVVTTTNNSYHLHQKTDTEISQENLKRFRQICTDQISAKGVYSTVAVKVIRDAQNDLRIDDFAATEIREAVMKSVKMRNEASLTTSEALALDDVKAKILNNRPKKNFELDITKLEGMYERTSVEDVQFYYNFLLSAFAPAKLKEDYLNRFSIGNPDEYWQTFWVSYSFLRSGEFKLYEESKSLLDGWEDKPEANVLLLTAVEKASVFFHNQDQVDDLDSAKSLTRMVLPNLSDFLKDFANSLNRILEGVTSVTVTRNFYTSYFFNDFKFNSFHNQQEQPTTNQISLAQSTRDSRPQKAQKKTSPGLFALGFVAVVIIAFLLFKPSRKDSAASSAIKQDPVVSAQSSKSPVESKDSEAKQFTVSQSTSVEAESKTPTNNAEPSKSSAKPANSPSSPAVASNTAVNSTGSVSLPYGTYKGPLKSGKPNGEGKVTVTKAYTLDNKSGKSFNLEPGDYLDAEFKDGQLLNAYWYGSDGKKKGSIVIAQ